MYNIITLLCVASVFALCHAELKLGDPNTCMESIPSSRIKTKLTYKPKYCKTKPVPCIIRVNVKYIERSVICCVDYQYEEPGVCKPTCTEGCVNGTCIAPGECSCEPPLTLLGHTCVPPVCDPPCTNGKCIANNTCACDHGFHSLNISQCAPICPKGYFNNPIECTPKCDNECVNSTCTAPNTCTCNPRHKLKENDNFTCVPECDPPCSNGECVAPGVCSCHDGFVPENTWKCKPVCDKCVNGDCVAPNKCDCHDGYSKTHGVCTPDCDQPCSNGICAEPNKCECESGYKLDANNKFNCLPFCESDCVNASCVSPNLCSCLNGYETAGNNWTCKPTCENCENGDCVAPGQCLCHYGYTAIGGKCTPVCAYPCKYGRCSKPDICSCDDGYELSSSDKFTCDPICESGCVNATCDAPNICSCLEGYEPTEVKSICKPHCTECNCECVGPEQCRCPEKYTADLETEACPHGCVNGVCSPDGCKCNEGYLENDTNSSVCYKPCEELCLNGRCDINGTCTCYLGYVFNNITNICTLIEPVQCNDCGGSCGETQCMCPNNDPCVPESVPEKSASTPSLAGLGLTWAVGSALGFLLLVLVIIVIQRLWIMRKEDDAKNPEDGGVTGSVTHGTVPLALLQNRTPRETYIQDSDGYYDEISRDNDEPVHERLLEVEEGDEHL